MRIAYIIFAVLVFGFTGYVLVTDNPRSYLEDRYARVSSMELDFFGAFRCNFFGKHRLTYAFTATREDGSSVRGYVCYTKGNFLNLADPVVHEEL